MVKLNFFLNSGVIAAFGIPTKTLKNCTFRLGMRQDIEVLMLAFNIECKEFHLDALLTVQYT
jgi:hypothetical protein